MIEQLNKIAVPAHQNKTALGLILPIPSQQFCHNWQPANENASPHLICTQEIIQLQIDPLAKDLARAHTTVKWSIERSDYSLN